MSCNPLPASDPFAVVAATRGPRMAFLQNQVQAVLSEAALTHKISRHKSARCRVRHAGGACACGGVDPERVGTGGAAEWAGGAGDGRGGAVLWIPSAAGQIVAHASRDSLPAITYQSQILNFEPVQGSEASATEFCAQGHGFSVLLKAAEALLSLKQEPATHEDANDRKSKAQGWMAVAP
jgi:hypothetical protein